MNKLNKIIYNGDELPIQKPKEHSNKFLNRPYIRNSQTENNNIINIINNNYDGYGDNNFNINNYNNIRNNNNNNKIPNEEKGMSEKI